MISELFHVGGNPLVAEWAVGNIRADPPLFTVGLGESFHD